MVNLLNGYPQKYPHLVILTGGPLDRELSLCHLDRSGEIWHTSRTDFPTSDCVLRSKWHTATVLRIYRVQYSPRRQGYIAYAKLFKDRERECKKKKNVQAEFHAWKFFFFCIGFFFFFATLSENITFFVISLLRKNFSDIDFPSD